MNREETKMIIKMLSAVYANEFGRKSQEQLTQMIDVWSVLFKDEDANMIANATEAYLKTSTNAFAPTPGMLIQKAHDIFDKPGMTELEAWGYVDKALKNSGYHSKEEWEKLPHEVKMYVTPKQLQAWAQDTNFNASVESSNFQRSFRAREKARIEYERLPKETKALIQHQTPTQHKRIEQIVEYPKIAATLTKEEEEEIEKLFAQLGEN